MEVKEVKFNKPNEKGKAEVWLRPSHSLGIFVVELEFHDPEFGKHREEVIKRSIGIPGVVNEHAQAIQNGNTLPLSDYVREDFSTVGRFDVPGGKVLLKFPPDVAEEYRVSSIQEYSPYEVSRNDPHN